MTSTRKMLLGTVAATIAVTGGVSTGAMAADAMLKKAPPIQYVRICDRYGYGFFQIPGSSICLQLRGQVQSDNDYQPTHDILFMAPDSKTAKAHTPTIQFANQQDHWSYEVTAKPRFDARTETSMGTSAFRTSWPGCTTRRILPATTINITVSSASATSMPLLPGIRSRRLPPHRLLVPGSWSPPQAQPPVSGQLAPSVRHCMTPDGQSAAR
jgi:hypothetical protein